MYYGYGYGLNYKSSGVAFDTDAQAFITAASIIDPTQQSAVNQLVLDLKAASIWTKMRAVYPFVGGSASTHKWNLKDPRDLDAAFRLTFLGGWTHNSNGITGNGSTSYADTFLIPSTNLTLNSSHISLYIKSNVSENSYDMGSAVDPDGYITMSPRRGDDTFRTLVNSGLVSSTSNTDSRGFYTANRTASNIENGWKSGVKIINTSNVAGLRNNKKMFIGALNYDGTPLAYSSKQIAFSSIGDGLSDTEASNLYTAVQAFQTTLSRNV